MKFTIKNIVHIIAAIAGIVLITACKEDTDDQDKTDQEQRFFDLYVGANYPDVVPQSNGLYFLEHKAGTGSSPDSDDWVMVNHVCYKIPEDIIYESYVENVAIDHQFYDTIAMYGPYKMLNGSRNPGLTEGLTLMSEGSQATIFFTSDLGYGSEGEGKVSPYESLKYEVELLEVIKDMDAYEQAKIDTYMDTVPQYDTIHDPETDAIMYYIIDEATDGKQVATDSLIEVAYKGYLIDGRVFDEKTAAAPLEMKVGGVEVINGWDLGLLKLKEGEKARFIIPYQLGYDEAGSEAESGLRVVPPYETLLFDIEIISVKFDPEDASKEVDE
ncbi:MAG: FKBP-type peptidyl-prolyl cis-trans isomerase [Bacteroidota bacterium]